MADDCDGLRPSFVVFGNERSPENRLDPEHGEEPGRHTGARHALRLRPIRTKVGGTGPVGGGAREEIGLLRPINEIQIRDVAVGNARLRIFSFDVDDAFRVRKRQRSEENAVDQTEDGGVRANAEPERNNGDGGEAGIFEKHPPGVPQIAPYAFYIITGLSFSDLFLQLLDPAQLHRGLSARLDFGQSFRDFLFHKSVQGISKFVRELLFYISLSKQVPPKSGNAIENAHRGLQVARSAAVIAPETLRQSFVSVWS